MLSTSAGRFKLNPQSWTASYQRRYKDGTSSLAINIKCEKRAQDKKCYFVQNSDMWE